MIGNVFVKGKSTHWPGVEFTRPGLHVVSRSQEENWPPTHPQIPHLEQPTYWILLYIWLHMTTLHLEQPAQKWILYSVELVNCPTRWSLYCHLAFCFDRPNPDKIIIVWCYSGTACNSPLLYIWLSIHTRYTTLPLHLEQPTHTHGYSSLLSHICGFKQAGHCRNWDSGSAPFIMFTISVDHHEVFNKQTNKRTKKDSNHFHFSSTISSDQFSHLWHLNILNLALEKFLWTNGCTRFHERLLKFQQRK